MSEVLIGSEIAILETSPIREFSILAIASNSSVVVPSIQSIKPLLVVVEIWVSEKSPINAVRSFFTHRTISFSGLASISESSSAERRAQTSVAILSEEFCGLTSRKSLCAVRAISVSTPSAIGMSALTRLATNTASSSAITAPTMFDPFANSRLIAAAANSNPTPLGTTAIKETSLIASWVINQGWPIAQPSPTTL